LPEAADLRIQNQWKIFDLLITSSSEMQMIDYTGLVVSDIHRSKNFYRAALAPIGLNLFAELPASLTGCVDAAGFSESSDSQFWIAQGNPSKPGIHVAFHVESPDMVDQFFNAAINAGGKNNGDPCVRSYYRPNYYSAFVLDPDGHSIEAFCHG
jgi:catechol 2,3-dioxygenase-like lactoylglutathione lyase family enzyme